MGRTVIGEKEYLIDPDSGKNKLFNVLNAYAHFDPEIGYCQGLNFIAALLIKVMETEEDAFYCLVHIMVVHNWRGCFDPQLSKLASLMDFLECVLETAYTGIYEHIMRELEISLTPLF